MIMGILCLIIFIVGFFLLFYGNDDGDLLLLTLGIIMCVIGLFGLIAFVGINIDAIKNWFKIK